MHRACALAPGMGLCILSVAARADYRLNLPPPQSSVAQAAFDLHILVLWVCLAIFVVVFGAMFHALVRHRKSLGHAAQPFHEHTAVEIVWSVIPFLILVGLAWPATVAILERRDTANPDLTIKVTGLQWKWEYDYLHEGVKYLSVLATPRDQIENRAAKGAHYLLEVDEPMVVPAGRKVRLLFTARDVIHSWWVPALGIKQDAIPGFIRDAWFRAGAPGVHRGQCAELCGRDHAFMPIVVEVKPEADYRAWLAGKRAKLALAAREAGKTFALSELMARGERLYDTHCAACHQPDGRGLPGTFPALAGSNTVTGDKTAHLRTVLDGRPGTAMQAFGGQLSDAELAAVLTYERNAWGNHAGPVQPAEVRTARR